MKKTFLILALTLCAFSWIVQGQEKKLPIPTIQEGAKWDILETVKAYLEEGKGLHVQETTIIYQLDGTQTLDGKSYFRLQEMGKDALILFREDLDEGKIYIRYNGLPGNLPKKEPIFSQDLLLFDYNVKEGDYINLYDRYGFHYISGENPDLAPQLQAQVTSIEVQKIGGVERRVYSLYHKAYESNLRWIEGIGFDQGGLFTSPVGMVPRPYETLLCHTEQEGKTLYFHSSNQCKVGWYLGEDIPLIERTDVSIRREGNHLIIESRDGKSHSFSVFEADGSCLLQNISFSESYSWPVSPEEKGEKILIVVDQKGSFFLL